MRQVDAGAVARGGIAVEHEYIARAHRDLAGGEGADAQLRALQVGQDRDRAASFGLDLAHGIVARAVVFVRAVAEVQPEHVGARLEQFADYRDVGACGSKRGNDLRFALASHDVSSSIRGRRAMWRAG
ncbi:hypothetical protein D3C78_1538860 [compost metagenome]